MTKAELLGILVECLKGEKTASLALLDVLKEEGQGEAAICLEQMLFTRRQMKGLMQKLMTQASMFGGEKRAVVEGQMDLVHYLTKEDPAPLSI